MLLIKDPGARVDYAIDWSDAYPGAVVIAAAEWSVDPVAAGGVSVAAAAHDLLCCTATLAGGAAGCVYRITNRVTLSDGQVDERSIVLRVEER